MRKDMFLHSLALFEENMAQLASPVDEKRKQKGKQVVFHYTGISRNTTGDAVVLFEAQSQSDPSSHYNCVMSVIPKNMSLFAVAHNQRKLGERIAAIKNADVKCFCSCPDFQYSGAEYNMKHKYHSLETDHSSRPSSDMFPKVRDPEGKHTLCKHLMAICSGMLTNASSIMGDARKATFPEKEKTDPSEIKALNKKDDNSAKQTTIPDTLDKGKKDTNPVMAQDMSSVKMLNGNLENTEPSEVEAINSLSTAAPVEGNQNVSDAMNTLAGTLTELPTEEDDAIETVNSIDDESESNVPEGQSSDDGESTVDVSSIPALNKGKVSPMDFDESPNHPMFDQPVD